LSSFYNTNVPLSLAKDAMRIFYVTPGLAKTFCFQSLSAKL